MQYDIIYAITTFLYYLIRRRAFFSYHGKNFKKCHRKIPNFTSIQVSYTLKTNFIFLLHAYIIHILIISRTLLCYVFRRKVRFSYRGKNNKNRPRTILNLTNKSIKCRCLIEHQRSISASHLANSISPTALKIWAVRFTSMEMTYPLNCYNLKRGVRSTRTP